jgi:FKBP12-rapamycin complex-associated protein
MYAGKCHAFAKALHYKELEFEEKKTPGTVEALIYINNQLQQTDAAVGILRNAQKYRDFELKETWFEKLERWDEALGAYNKREREGFETFETTMGKMRCLHALGEWDLLSNLAEEKWNLAAIDQKRAIAPLAAASAWGLGQWELMDNYLDAMKSQSPDRSFFGAILSLHRNQFERASEHIEKAREALDTELSALLGESYNRAYGVVVRVQMLAELEEIITYKKSNGNPLKQATMRETWTKRLKGCQRNPEVWQRMLKVRALVISPQENIDMWIKFANLCRKSGRMGLADKSLDLLRNVRVDTESSRSTGSFGAPEVLYAKLKHQWADFRKEDSLQRLRDFTTELSYQLSAHNARVTTEDPSNPNGITGYDVDGPIFPVINTGPKPPSPESVSMTKLLAKCYLKQGEWLTALKDGDWKSDHVHEIIASYAHATSYNKGWYKAWHAWALANFEVVTAISSQANRETANLPQAVIKDHVMPAVQGFFKSIALSSTSSLQDTLRLLTLWFAHGGDSEVDKAIGDGFRTVSVDTWLEVIPQLIARINQPNKKVRESIHDLLATVGKSHPQALVYPLTVVMKSNVARRSQAASLIMDKLREHSPNLVEQANLVSHELIRVAVLWHELWHEGLEEASRLYFGDQDINGMFRTLAPLHDLIDKGAETLREISFNQTFGRDLAEAKQWCNTYRNSHDVADLNQAWDLYYSVFRRIARHLPHLMTLDLTYVSPKLKEARNLDLAVPGTYQSGKPVIRIVSFDHVFTVIPSKQRPRKMTLRGSDGVAYTYALKGHEDIRQDERVMQLFGLVNTLLNNDSESFKRHLSIQQFPAIPLSQNSGLLGWVPNSDTLHNLIKEYRETRNILLNIEHRIMLQMAPDYDNLTLMQKVEVFSYAMDNTTGKDLYRVLWLKSKSSESWLQRRTNYTRSLAVMSIVGYILGLGDRHPSNLMLDRITGKVVHIDFGDCFEVAMSREKYPERVPFRLTRMLTFAMEVSNIDGSFKLSCEAVMRVIRANKESLMAVLEAFIHDPLLNWRLGNRESPPEPSFTSERRQSLIGEEASLQFQQMRSGGSYRARRMSTAGDGTTSDGQNNMPVENKEVQNERALKVLERVKVKLTGRDFKPHEELDVERQVSKLIGQATNVENLCQHYIGWCSFW